MNAPTPPPRDDRFTEEPIVIHPAELRAAAPASGAIVASATVASATGVAATPWTAADACAAPGPGHPPHPAYGTPQVFVTTTVNTPIVVRTSSCPHALHLVLTLLTCGLWLPIWIIDAIARG